jgi:hypothetical protein
MVGVERRKLLSQCFDNLPQESIVIPAWSREVNAALMNTSLSPKLIHKTTRTMRVS